MIYVCTIKRDLIQNFHLPEDWEHNHICMNHLFPVFSQRPAHRLFIADFLPFRTLLFQRTLYFAHRPLLFNRARSSDSCWSETLCFDRCQPAWTVNLHECWYYFCSELESALVYVTSLFTSFVWIVFKGYATVTIIACQNKISYIVWFIVVYPVYAVLIETKACIFCEQQFILAHKTFPILLFF